LRIATELVPRMPLGFRHRATESEIIDDMSLDAAEMERVLGNLAVINRYLGGYATTVRAFEKLVPPGDSVIRVLDVGAGGGDMARRLVDWGRAHEREVQVVTCDLSFAAAAFAARSLAGTGEASVVQADVMALPFRERSFDVVMCSLFAHHFPTPVVARFLVAMHAISTRGVILNDLHRHPLAFAGIWALTRILPASPVVRNDGPLSVRRAFVREDLAELERLSGLSFKVRWCWAFRWQVVIHRDAHTEVRRA